MKKTLLIMCFIISSWRVDANAYALLASFIEFYRTEVAVIIEKLNNTFGSVSALLAADKEATTTMTHAQTAMYKSSQSLRNTLNLSSAGDVGRFHVGGITPSGCIRQKSGDLSADLFVNVVPEIDKIKKLLDENISQEGPSFRASIKRGKDVAAIIANNTLKDKINPFSLSRNISVDEASDLSKIVEYIVNPEPPNLLPRPNTINDAQYHSRRLRYELFVHVIQTSMMNRVASYVRGRNGESQNDYIMRLSAKANALNISESMVTKYEAGQLREVNGTLADILSMEMINQKVRQDLIALNSIIATKSTDKLVEDL